MMWDNLFLAANAVAVAAWAILLFGVVRGRSLAGAARVVGALLAIAYLLIFVSHAGEAAVLVRDYSISGVQAFFAHPALAVVGWVHYLVFDLWVGTWEVENAPDAMPRGLLIFTLLLTFAVGPIGLCAFLAARAWAERSGKSGI